MCVYDGAELYVINTFPMPSCPRPSIWRHLYAFKRNGQPVLSNWCASFSISASISIHIHSELYCHCCTKHFPEYLNCINKPSANLSALYRYVHLRISSIVSRIYNRGWQGTQRPCWLNYSNMIGMPYGYHFHEAINKLSGNHIGISIGTFI